MNKFQILIRYNQTDHSSIWKLCWKFEFLWGSHLWFYGSNKHVKDTKIIENKERSSSKRVFIPQVIRQYWNRSRFFHLKKLSFWQKTSSWQGLGRDFKKYQNLQFMVYVPRIVHTSLLEIYSWWGYEKTFICFKKSIFLIFKIVCLFPMKLWSLR